MIRFKLLILFFILLFARTSYSEWIIQNTGTERNIVSIKFINVNTGWACGEDIVLITANGGNTWTPVNVPGTHQAILFTDALKGYLVSRSGGLRISVNGGYNWSIVNSGVTADLNSITFLNQSTGIITGVRGVILKTTDAGLSWHPAAAPSAGIDYFSSYIINEQNLFVIGSQGSIFKSTNFGSSWTDNSQNQVNPFFTIFFANQNTGWVAGCCGMYFKTVDGGLNWTPEAYLTPGQTINSSKFISETKGWMAANGGIILKTTGGGDTWLSLESGTLEDLKAVDFINENTGWIAGNFGTILKTTNGGGEGTPIGIHNISSEVPPGYRLGQNYPNPFNPATSITFDIPKDGTVSLIMYDAAGNETGRFNYGRLNAGLYNINYNASHLPSGVYYYRLIAEGFTSVKKMVLLK